MAVGTLVAPTSKMGEPSVGPLLWTVTALKPSAVKFRYLEIAVVAGILVLAAYWVLRRRRAATI